MAQTGGADDPEEHSLDRDRLLVVGHHFGSLVNAPVVAPTDRS